MSGSSGAVDPSALGVPSTSLISNPTSDVLSLFLVQVILVLAIVRLLAKALAKVKQPPVIGEILAGVVLGPSVMGYLPGFESSIFPSSSLVVLGVVSQVGLILFMFFLGLELDESLFAKYWRTACPIALASVVVPFGLGCALSPLLYPLDVTVASHATFTLFIGTALAFTAFPLLARILTSFHLLDTPFGEHVLAIAAIDDILAWCTLALTLSYAGGSTAAKGVYTALLTVAYLLVMVLLIRPGLLWLSRQRRFRQKVAGELNRDYVCVLLLLLCASSLWTEISGIHAFFGAFVLGVVVPKGRLADGESVVDVLAPKIELLIVELFLPLYFAFSGLRTTLGSLDTGHIWVLAVLVIVVATASKVIPVTLVTRYVTWQRRLTDDEGELEEEEEARRRHQSDGQAKAQTLEMADLTPTPGSKTPDASAQFSYEAFSTPTHHQPTDEHTAASADAAPPAPVPSASHGAVSSGEPTPRGYAWRACLSVGLLMNTTGLVTLIALNIGLDRGILGPKVFSLMVLMALVTTFMTSPLFHSLYYVPFIRQRERRHSHKQAREQAQSTGSAVDAEAERERAEEEREELSIAFRVMHLVLNPDRPIAVATLKPLSTDSSEPPPSQPSPFAASDAPLAGPPSDSADEDSRAIRVLDGAEDGGRARSSSDSGNIAAVERGVYSNKLD